VKSVNSAEKNCAYRTNILQEQYIMTTLPANASIASNMAERLRGEYDGGNDVSNIEGDFDSLPASTTASPVRKTDIISKVGGDGRVAAAILATGTALAGGINAGVKPALEAAGGDSRIVQAIAGVEPRPEISFTKKAGTPAQSHTEMLSVTGAAEIGNKNGQVPGRR
jgi:hypothetical protein